MKKNSLHALFESNQEVLQHAQKLVSLSHWRCSSTPTRVNEDKSISYSLDQWVYFQRLDPVLRPAMDTSKNIQLAKPIDRKSVPFIKNGFLDDNWVLKYKYFCTKEANPRLLTVVPHVLQIPLLSFHKIMGCESKDQTVQRAPQFVYFKYMNKVFDVM